MSKIASRSGSPSSVLIGTETVGFDEESGTARLRFTAPDSFASPRGAVQGGLVAAFLDEAMGAAVLHATKGDRLPLNLDFNISCLKPVPIGPLIGVGRVVRLGRNVAFLEGELYDGEGETLLARSTSTAMLTG